MSNDTRTAVLVSFSGFYESVHCMMIDDAIEQMFQNDDGTGEAPEAFHNAFHYTKPMLESYCKSYVDVVKSHLEDEGEIEVESMAFESLYSPRFYNFETDRIFVNLSESDIQKLYDRMLDNQDVMSELLMEYFTPASGFIPHYSNDIREWLAKDLSEWDHNEIGMLILAAAGGSWNDMDLINGADTFREKVDEAVSNHMPKKAEEILDAHEAARAA